MKSLSLVANLSAGIANTSLIHVGDAALPSCRLYGAGLDRVYALSSQDSDLGNHRVSPLIRCMICVLNGNNSRNTYCHLLESAVYALSDVMNRFSYFLPVEIYGVGRN
jgi:hypothetical protein